MRQAFVEALLAGYPRLRARLYTSVIRGAFCSVGRKVSISPPFRFANLSRITLGRGVTIHSNCWMHALAFEHDSPAPKIVLADHVCLGMNATISAARRVDIGEHVFTARNVYISDHAHEFRDASVPIAQQGIGDVAEVSIGAYTWIGQNAVILPGVKIGRHCVIGANAVVNTDVPDYCVAAGVPARVIRTYNPASKTWDRVHAS